MQRFSEALQTVNARTDRKSGANTNVKRLTFANGAFSRCTAGCLKGGPGSTVAMGWMTQTDVV